MKESVGQTGVKVFQLEGNETLTDYWDPSLQVVAPDTFRVEPMDDIDGLPFIRVQGSTRVIGVQASNIYEAIQKFKASQE